MMRNFEAFDWLVQVAYDWGQIAAASRQYDGQAAAKFSLLSEICAYVADRIRPMTWFSNEILAMRSTGMELECQTVSSDTVEISDDGSLKGYLVEDVLDILRHTPASRSSMAIFTAGASGDEVDKVLTYLDSLVIMGRSTFPALALSALNSIGRKLALFENISLLVKIEYQPYEIPTEIDDFGKPIVFCSICGAPYTHAYEKCEICETPWSAAEFWPIN